jgi:predicted nucleic acid-binding protein
MIVVDSNIIVYLCVPGKRSNDADLALRKDPHWIAPLSWRSEFRNVLAFYVRKKRLTLTAAQEIMDNALQLMAGQEHEVDSAHALRLTAESGCSAYDCEFVALAQSLGIELVTVDKQVLSAFPDTAVALDRYVSGK